MEKNTSNSVLKPVSTSNDWLGRRGHRRPTENGKGEIYQQNVNAYIISIFETIWEAGGGTKILLKTLLAASPGTNAYDRQLLTTLFNQRWN